MAKERIGFIGVGLMGHGMAANIVDKGWPLTVLGHRNREPVEDLKRRGAAEASTPARACRSQRYRGAVRDRQSRRSKPSSRGRTGWRRRASR